MVIGIQPLFSQQLSNVRIKIYALDNDTIQIDTVSIIPGSLNLKDAATKENISSEDFSLNALHSLLIWRGKARPDSILAEYKVLPYSLTKSIYHKDYSQLNKRDSLSRLPIIYSLQELNPNGTLDLGGVDYNGSFSRGITFGNNQDLVVNSNFNLQLQGKLAGDVEVLAALSDNNIPIQPEGNTQQLQEFDKVFIQLKKSRSTLVVGDYELSKPEGYFMNFYKKLQGASFLTTSDTNHAIQLKSNASIAVAKGKYAKNNLIGIEGNQGPYRLVGNNGETYIIILAGTERVYIDGEIMVRGSDRDYVIDYNAGEIVFTPNRLITKDKRISVEFQYSEKAYLRTIFFAGQQFSHDAWKVRVNFYSEQDAKNQPVQQELTDSQRVVLSEAGDSIQKAYYQSIDSVGYTPDRVLYKKIDSIGYDVYVYSINTDSAIYSLNFSYTGLGKGNYVIANNLVNGRVYRWIAPVGGIPQGDYEPVIPLIAPQRTQLLTVGVDYNINENSSVSWEGGLSNQDINTFSSAGNSDNSGVSSILSYQQKIILNHDKQMATNLFTTARYEFTGQNFKAIERYRPVEFERDWNITTIQPPADEHLASVNLNLQRNAIGNLQYGASFFNRSGIYTGINNSLTGNYNHHGFQLTFISSYLLSENDSQKTKFLRPSINVSQALRFLKGAAIGINGKQEYNRLISTPSDTLSASSFYWNEGRIYLHSHDSSKIKMGIDYSSRIDYVPIGIKFKRATLGNTASFSAEFSSNPASVLRLSLTYRKLKVEDTSLTIQQPDESVLARAGYDLQIKKGFITSNTLYEIGSVQEQKKEFTYAPVPDGTGIYTWIDYNENGVQEINEFEIAAFQSDADYIKLLIPTNEFIKAYSTIFNESFTINPKTLWKSSEGLRDLISRFSSLVSLQINKKTLEGNLASQFNPFLLNISDNVLITEASLMSGFLYFNKTNPKYGLDFSYQSNRSKTLLTNGVEARTNKNYGLRLRWNISRKFSTIIKAEKNEKVYAAEFYPGNNYFIKGYLGEPQFVYQPSSVLRITLGYEYSNSENLLGEVGERALNNKVTLDLKYNVIAKSVININTMFANVDYIGAPNTPVQYTMLEGLQSGQNYLLNVSFDRKLSQFIEMSISYEGRLTGDNPIVNTGRAQVRALF